jgi:UPF0755 protein
MILLLLACGLEDAPRPGDTGTLEFEVPRGATARGLADELEATGLVRDAWRWEWFLRAGADGSCVKAGVHEVGPGMAAPELLAALCSAPIPDEVPFTVVEGWRARDIDAALAAAGLAKPGAYLEAAADPGAIEASFALPESGLEGYLFPETYQVPRVGMDVGTLVRRQVAMFQERFYATYSGEAAPAAGEKRTLHEVVIMASMLEREEPSPKNRPLVSGILWKRLDADWNLGVDATSRYTLDDWNDRKAFLKKLRDPADPWNTRLRGGLPPTPIGNPGLAALEAALRPVASDAWYYLHDSEKALHTGRDVREHEANRRRYGVY